MNWIDALGWVASAGIVIGFLLNSNRKVLQAFLVWIVADFMWIYYDYLIGNWSHASLSTLIIFMNLYGIWKLKKDTPLDLDKAMRKHYEDQ